MLLAIAWLTWLIVGGLITAGICYCVGLRGRARIRKHQSPHHGSDAQAPVVLATVSAVAFAFVFAGHYVFPWPLTELILAYLLGVLVSLIGCLVIRKTEEHPFVPVWKCLRKDMLISFGWPFMAISYAFD